MIDWDRLWRRFRGEEKPGTMEEKRELAEAGKALLEDKAFSYAMMQRMEEIIGSISADRVSTEQLIELRAELRAIQELPGRLNALMVSFKNALTKQKAA